MKGYPKPRYIQLERPKSVEELMPRARALVGEKRQEVSYMSLRPKYGIKPGYKVLLVALSEHDPMVFEAMCRAIREKGARVDLFTLDSTPVATPEELAAHEAISLDKDEPDGYNYFYSIFDQIRINTAKALVETEKYDIVIAGNTGPIPAVPFTWKRFNAPYMEDFVGPAIDMPQDLLDLIDQKVFDQVSSCKKMWFTDPEGTDMKWTNYNDERTLLSDHILGKPFNIGHGFNGKDDAAGIICGTTGHMGAFPLMKVYVERGQVVKIEGGGIYGEAWREKLEKYRKVKAPPIPLAGKSMGMLPEGAKVPMYQIKDPGFFYYFEHAIGTNPAMFRLPKESRLELYCNMLHERRRSGWVHHGFGLPVVGWTQLRKAGLPWSHVHVHSMFGTLEGKNSKGESILIIDKGHLTALDAPEIKALAGKYGNPDELLAEVWIPAIPGINVPGDYMKDYARDPISWMKKEAAEHPVWLGEE